MIIYLYIVLILRIHTHTHTHTHICLICLYGLVPRHGDNISFTFWTVVTSQFIKNRVLRPHILFESLFSLLSLFRKNKSRFMWLICCHCILPTHQLLIGLISLYKICMYVMAPEPISMAYFINSSDQSVCLYVYATLVARHRLRVAMEELLDALCSAESISYQRK
jgi:hypothetical protein